MPALLEGDPGLGKSLIALDLCARLSRGRPFPDGSPSPGPCNCLVLNSEDNPGEVRSRLVQLQADLERIFLIEEQGPCGETVRLPSQLDRLDRALERSAARLAVFDPVVDFLDANVNPNSDLREVYPSVTPLDD
jgi:RecA-family ATPase